MSEYGSHPTIYGGLSDLELYRMYRWDSWHRLDEDHRQQLLQETVNRAALQNGEKGSCRVVFADLDSSVAGAQSGQTITVNRSLYADDLRMTAKNGVLQSETKIGNNMDALTTVLHEDQHAYQNQIIDGTVPAPDPALRAEYAANNFNHVTITEPDGSERRGLTYIQGHDSQFGYSLYYLQSTERDAHRFSEERTVQIMDMLEQDGGNEPSFDEYRKELAANGYAAAVEHAQELFGNDAVEQEVNQSLMNHVYGSDEAVTPEIDRLVEHEMIATYEGQYHFASVSAQVETESVSEAGASVSPEIPECAGALTADSTESAGTCETSPDIEDGLEEGGIE